MTTKRCRHCNTSKPISEMASRRCRLRSGEVRLYVLGWCIDCRRAYRRKRSAKDRGYRHVWRLANHFGLTVDEYDALLAAQGGVCAVCKRAESKIDFRSKQAHALSIDHDHTTNVARGLLCNTCNRGLGTVSG